MNPGDTNSLLNNIERLSRIKEALENRTLDSYILIQLDPEDELIRYTDINILCTECYFINLSKLSTLISSAAAEHLNASLVSYTKGRLSR